MPNPDKIPTPDSIIESALTDCSKLRISFEDAARYNQELRHTFFRTVRDVSRIGTELRILEVGTFTGVVSASLRRLGHQVTALDIPFVISDPELVRFFEMEGIQPCAVDLSSGKLPLEEEMFDVIIFNEVLEHLNFNPIPLLRDFYRVLIPNGRIYCATPNLVAAKNRLQMLRGRSYINPVEHLIWNLIPGSGMAVGIHWREWTKSELIELFSVADFHLESHRYGLVTPNRSGFIRRHAVSVMYTLFPALMPNQVSIFRKNVVGSGEQRST